ncbi:MAG: alpha/beta fold hydrolase [Myxococcales bacterium]|nr:alpha/beta fold hydrolase [Myxococcales bacterium]
MARRHSRARGFGGGLQRISKGAQNAMEVLRLGRLTPRQGATFEVVHQERMFKLRRYAGVKHPGGARVTAPLVLIPPLMLTAEIYDVSPELSAVSVLTSEGIDPWVIDFGAPEQEEGGMERTLDDHVRAVAKAIRLVAEHTGTAVHLAGYSQGGMFAYQAAAYLQSSHLASVITFGSPVDIHANLPSLSNEVAERVIGMARTLVEYPLTHMEGLPGILTSTGFKLLTPVKEAQQLVDFVLNLHDRQALEKRESRRRFLGGEGFVAWPGPALRKFIDEFVVHNRLASGGFVIDGRSVTLADIRCPVLAFVGERDDIARPPSVRAIANAAPNAEVYEIPLPAGHFGLVVGSTSLRQTWPSVVQWLRWREGLGELPDLITDPNAEPEVPEFLDDDDEVGGFNLDVDIDLFVDTAASAVSSAWKRLGHAFEDAADAVDNLRFQLPRLSQLRRLGPDSRISMAAVLARQAKHIPEQTFFLFRGRAFSYADADRRVNHVVRGLISCGVRRGTRVGVLMEGRPSYLSVVAALNRIGAIAVLLSPDASRIALSKCLEVGEAEFLVSDPGHAELARESFGGDVLVLGGGGRVRNSTAGVIDMEQIDPDRVELPAWYEPNPGKSGDLAMIIFTSGRYSKPRAARITNRRWAFSAYGAAAACTLTGKDTVYCCLPLHHQSGMLVSVGGGLVGGARLALASRFTPELFWKEVRRYGATVVFYAGEMCRQLVNAPVAPSEHINPLRLFAGSGMRKDVWYRLRDRFGVGVLEFYASSEGNAVLANASGKKLGALGRPLPGATDMAIVRYDFDRGELIKDARGWLVSTKENEWGMMISRVDSTHPSATLAGYAQDPDTAKRIVRGAFEADDVWFLTGDILRQDDDGDYWYVDRASDMIRTVTGPVATTEIEDALYELPEVGLAVAYALRVPGTSWQMPVAALVPQGESPLEPSALLAVIERELPLRARPRFIRVRSQIAMTDGYRPIKAPLIEAGIRVRSTEQTFWYDSERHSYEHLDQSGFAEAVRQAGGSASELDLEEEAAS